MTDDSTLTWCPGCPTAWRTGPRSCPACCCWRGSAAPRCCAAAWPGTPSCGTRRYTAADTAAPLPDMRDRTERRGKQGHYRGQHAAEVSSCHLGKVTTITVTITHPVTGEGTGRLLLVLIHIYGLVLWR